MGFRTHEEERAFDGETLDEYLIENEEATFCMRARGGAMRGAGILDGDLLIVDRSKEPRPDDIVIAVADGAFRMGFMRSLSGADCKVEAVVTGVVRKYR